jgi:hypothetical protein
LATIKDYDTIELVLEPAWKSRYWAKTQICKKTLNETNIVKIVLKNLPYPSIAGKFEDQQSTGQELHLTTELSILFVKYQTSVLHAPSTLGKQQKSTCGSVCRNSLLYHLAEVGPMISEKKAVKINLSFKVPITTENFKLTKLIIWYSHNLNIIRRKEKFH